jgi:hypothetical protein
MTARIRCLRLTVLATLGIALCASPIATADGRQERGSGGPVVPVHKIAGTPAGEFIGARTAEDYAAHAGDTPPADPCPIVGPRSEALVMAPTGETNACTVGRRTQLVIFGLGSACSDVEPPPFFGADEAAQRACAAAFDHGFVTELRVTVDARAPVDIRDKRFEVVSPQMTVQLPDDNVFDIPAQTATLVAHAWMAQIPELRPGRHTISVDAVTTEFAITSTFILDVLPDGSDDEQGEHQHD